MRRQLLPAIVMMVVFTVVLGIAYPLVVTGIAQGGFAGKANGSQLKVYGRVVGSKLLGQTFTRPEYFHGRPSAAGAAAVGAKGGDPKDLRQDISSGSNWGPTNPDLLSAVKERVADYRRENDLARGAKVPVDAVTASGSGLDPDISVANARLQAPRVARVRGLPVRRVQQLVDDHTDGRSFGFLGSPGVNVVELNVALDRLT
jgi:potassium-transporting ATPase KdpC subunit